MNTQNNRNNNMRQNRRARGRSGGGGGGGGGRKMPNPLTRSYESNGPDVKVRGTAANVAEKYQQLARDSLASGDPIAAENYYQHAEHYLRIIATAQAAQAQQAEERAVAEGSGDDGKSDQRADGRGEARHDGKGEGRRNGRGRGPAADGNGRDRDPARANEATGSEDKGADLSSMPAFLRNGPAGQPNGESDAAATISADDKDTVSSQADHDETVTVAAHGAEGNGAGDDEPVVEKPRRAPRRRAAKPAAETDGASEGDPAPDA